MKGHATLIGNTPITKDTNHVLNTSLDKLNNSIKWYHVPTMVPFRKCLLSLRQNSSKGISVHLVSDDTHATETYILFRRGVKINFLNKGCLI